MNDFGKQLVIWVLVFAVLLAVFKSFTPTASEPARISYSEFNAAVQDGSVQSVVFDDQRITGELSSGGR